MGQEDWSLCSFLCSQELMSQSLCVLATSASAFGGRSLSLNRSPPKVARGLTAQLRLVKASSC